MVRRIVARSLLLTVILLDACSNHGDPPAPPPAPPPPVRHLSASGAQIDEPDSGTAFLNFAVDLDGASSQTVSVHYATQDISATAGSDYVMASGTLTFAPGETHKLVAVTVTGDETIESDETFALNFSAPANATLDTSSVTGTLRNNDSSHSLGIDGATAAESAGSMTFTVHLEPASPHAVTVQYATADQTATAGADYTAASGTLSFAAGETAKTFTVAVLDDADEESTETFAVALSNATGGATIADANDTGTITDNDTAPPPASLDLNVLPDMLTADRCDFLDNHYCLFPWPNDFFTVAQAPTSNAYGASTTRKLNISVLSTPRNSEGKPLDPTEWNRNDGFSPGQAILLRVPGVDLARTGAVPITNVGDSFRAGQPIVVIDADTLERHLIWSEIDADITKFGPCDVPKPAESLASIVDQSDLADAAAALRAECAASPLPADPTVDNGPALIIRPAVNFKEGHRYIVALRNLKDGSGAAIAAAPAFRIYRDAIPSMLPQVTGRRAHMEEILGKLGTAGIDRASLYLAWDFTVASGRNLSERMLHIRDDAFTRLGAAAPSFTIRNVDTACAIPGNPGCPAHNGVVDHVGTDSTAREVFGTITVPSYLTLPGGSAGSRLFYAPGAEGQYGDGLPDINPLSPTQQLSFLCRIPRAAFGGATDPAAGTAVPARPAIYGHGLLGSMYEGGGQIGDMTNENNFIYCATDWIGMAGHQLDPERGAIADPIYRDPPGGDVPNVATILLDMSGFPTLADRVQQGVLQFEFLARTMIHAQGFCSSPAFQDAAGTCLIDRNEVFYDGNSQGGIIGGVVLATSPDIRAGVLGVPGMNYSTLLQRSVDFDAYAGFLYASYRSSLDQQFVLSFIQGLWDRAENDGYAEHLNASNPYVNTPPKRVLLTPAFGDHQVSMWTAEVMARTVGAQLHCPAVVAGTDPQPVPSVQPGPHPLVGLDPLDKNRRHPDDQPYFGIPCIAAYPFDGNALVVWDGGPTKNLDGSVRPDGVAPPPTDNTPPRPSLGYGADPHSFPRTTFEDRKMKSDFLKSTGAVTDTCGGEPCVTRGFDPTP